MSEGDWTDPKCAVWSCDCVLTRHAATTAACAACGATRPARFWGAPPLPEPAADILARVEARPWPLGRTTPWLVDFGDRDNGWGFASGPEAGHFEAVYRAVLERHLAAVVTHERERIAAELEAAAEASSAPLRLVEAGRFVAHPTTAATLRAYAARLRALDAAPATEAARG